jgi:hypothetical protein
MPVAHRETNLYRLDAQQKHNLLSVEERERLVEVGIARLCRLQSLIFQDYLLTRLPAISPTTTLAFT